MYSHTTHQYQVHKLCKMVEKYLYYIVKIINYYNFILIKALQCVCVYIQIHQDMFSIDVKERSVALYFGG